MWRALFLALGISLSLAGAECMFIDEIEVVNIKKANPTQATASNPFRAVSFQSLTGAKPTRSLPIKEWMPDKKEFTLEAEDVDFDAEKSAFYLVRVKQADEHQGWTSPIWFG